MELQDGEGAEISMSRAPAPTVGVCGRVRACACGRVELGGGGRGARLRVGAVCKA